MTTVDHVLERQAKMGNGVAGDLNRMARTRGDADVEGDATTANAPKTNGTEKLKGRNSAGGFHLLWNCFPLPCSPVLFSFATCG